MSRPILSSMRLISRLPPRIICRRLLASTFYSFSNLDRHSPAVPLHKRKREYRHTYGYHPIVVNDCHVRSYLHVRAAPLYVPAEKRPALAYKGHGVLHRHYAVFPELPALVQKVLGAGHGKRNAAVGAEGAGQPAIYAKVLYPPGAPRILELDV